MTDGADTLAAHVDKPAWGDVVVVFTLDDIGIELNVTFRAALLDGFPITSITALKPIKQGDELLIDYGKDFWLKNFGLDRYIAQFQHPALVSLHAQLSRHLAQDLG